MQHVLTPYSEYIHPFVWWENAFSNQELDWLQYQASNADQKATVGGNPNKESLDKIRRSDVSWISENNDTGWVFERLGHVVSSLNSQYYRFDLTGFGEPLQLTNYSDSEQGMYGWHQDYGGNTGPSRKMSLVLQLTDPSEYDGGNLQIMTTKNAINVPKQRGLIALFPSYIVHQVTPVIRGSRQSLVSWITGPAFK